MTVHIKIMQIILQYINCMIFLYLTDERGNLLHIIVSIQLLKKTRLPRLLYKFKWLVDHCPS